MINEEKQRKDEEWDDIVRERLKKQRAARGAKVKYVQLRQEIADLAIKHIEDRTAMFAPFYQPLADKVRELRALEEKYPEIKETT